jgi:hypothetical protein
MLYFTRIRVEGIAVSCELIARRIKRVPRRDHRDSDAMDATDLSLLQKMMLVEGKFPIPHTSIRSIMPGFDL